MNSTGERLREIIANQGITLKTFCEKNNFNYSGLSNIMNGERALGMNILRQLKDCIPNLDVNWLLFGEEKNEISKNENFVSEPGIDYLKSDPGKEMLLKYLDDTEVQKRILEIVTNKNQ